MLFQDSPISTLQDWLSYDSRLNALSESTSAKIEQKAALAKGQIRTAIKAFLIQQIAMTPISAGRKLDQLVITEPLQRWHAFTTLALYYEDLANLQNSDSHRIQSRLYFSKSSEAKDGLLATGLGFVNLPVPMGPVPGVNPQAGTQPKRFLRAKATFTGMLGAEGAPGNEFVIDQTNGEAVILRAPAANASLSGWMLYLAVEDGVFYRATENPLPLGLDVTVLSNWPLTSAVLMDAGQEPDHFILKTRLIRG